jgi:hypothetical protein
MPFDSAPSRARLMRKLLKKQMRPLRVMMKIDRNMDVRRALRGIALGGMASAIDRYGPLGDGRGSGWSGGFDGARAGRGLDPADRIDRSGIGAAWAFVLQ